MATFADLLALHRPDSPSTGEMVYSVWEDGEVTLEKGGDLFGRRTLHTIAFGGRSLDPQALPIVNAAGTHSRIYVGSNDDATRAQAIIAELTA